MQILTNGQVPLGIVFPIYDRKLGDAVAHVVQRLFVVALVEVVLESFGKKVVVPHATGDVLRRDFLTSYRLHP